jgi:HAD superfamily hydrolase (TIGR01509 family)
VVFDVDGTMVDSERHGHRVAFNQAFADLGLPFHWDEQRYGALLAVTGGERRVRTFLRTDPTVAAEGWAVERIDEVARTVHARKTELFTEMARSNVFTPRPGVTRLLDDLAQGGIAVGVATTGSREWVLPLLDGLFCLQRFAVVVTGAEAPQRKPHPSAYHQAVDLLGVDAGHVAAVEDSGPGVAAARYASLACLVVTNGYTEHDVARQAHLALDGFGDPDAPATVLVDTYETCPRGVVDLTVLRHLVSRVNGCFLPFE